VAQSPSAVLSESAASSSASTESGHRCSKHLRKCVGEMRCAGDLLCVVGGLARRHPYLKSLHKLHANPGCIKRSFF